MINIIGLLQEANHFTAYVLLVILGLSLMYQLLVVFVLINLCEKSIPITYPWGFVAQSYLNCGFFLYTALGQAQKGILPQVGFNLSSFIWFFVLILMNTSAGYCDGVGSGDQAGDGNKIKKNQN